MFRTMLMTTAMLLSMPAVAQTADPMQGTAPASPQQAMPANPAAPAQAAPQSATPGSPADSVATIVDTEFPAYDVNSDGQLDKAEFGKWMVALKDQEMKATGKMLPADKVTTWANGAFSTADTDKSNTVSKAELIAYLSRGAG